MGKLSSIFRRCMPANSASVAPSNNPESYVRNGRIPWSPGYSAFKDNFIRQTLCDPALMKIFRTNSPLPRAFGMRLDERVVEYPWVLSRLPSAGRILDAGSTLNAPFLLDLPDLRDRPIIIYTLAADYITLRPTVSYIFGDLRNTLLKDAVVEAIVCISTLEHIGFGPDFKRWSRTNPYPRTERQSYKLALAEFRRLLKDDGRLLLTVPYGRQEDHGWLQQFDLDGINEIKSAFGGDVTDECYYRYSSEGWQQSTAEACKDAAYFNIHASRTFGPDYAAAARAVTCIEFRKTS